MPARVVDGEAVWLSDKVKSLKPEHRVEYAYLIPLAEANGVFEADPERIWARAYSFHRSGIDPGWVRDLLEDFRRVDLLRTWTEKGKIWGWWTGIDKAGRLPSKKHLERYTNLPPSAPLSVRCDDPGESGINPG